LVEDVEEAAAASAAVSSAAAGRASAGRCGDLCTKCGRLRGAAWGTSDRDVI